MTPMIALALALFAPAASAQDADPSAAPADAAPACAASTADLQAILEQAQAQYAGLDVDGFKASTDEANALLPCLTDPLPRSLAATYHRFRGLRGFVDGDPVASTGSFAAARSIEPGYRFPESLIPAGNPVLVEYLAVDVEKGTYAPVAEPAVGRLTFDGRTLTQRPTGWPTVLQVYADDGGVSQTAWIGPGEPLPAYEVKADAVADGGGDAPIGAVKPKRKGPNLPMVAAGGGALVLSGVFYGLGASAHSQWEDPATMVTDLDGLRDRTNAMQTANIVSGVLGLGLVGASFAF